MGLLREQHNERYSVENQARRLICNCAPDEQIKRLSDWDEIGGGSRREEEGGRWGDQMEREFKKGERKKINKHRQRQKKGTTFGHERRRAARGSYIEVSCSLGSSWPGVVKG